jgi:hypothetical protein
MKILLLGVFAFICYSDIEAQYNLLNSRADSIEFVKSRMRQNGEIQSYAFGVSGQVSMQFQGFVYLTQTLSVEELALLQSDSSMVLQIYSYAALVHKRYKHTKEILAKFRSDSTLVPVMMGCGGGNMNTWAIVNDLSGFYNRKAFNQILRDKYQQQEAWQKRLFGGF